MENNIIWIKNLRTIREQRKITQLRLSVDMGVSQELISQYELGKSSPTPTMLVKLADYFNCSTDYLLGRTDITKPVKSLVLDKTNLIHSDVIDKYTSLSTENKKHFDSFLEFLTVYKSE